MVADNSPLLCRSLSTTHRRRDLAHEGEMALPGMVGRAVRKGQSYLSKYGNEVMVYSFGSRIREGPHSEMIRPIRIAKIRRCMVAAECGSACSQF
jgi:hypothetical protein